MNKTSVLIVGAGPVGLTLACELARRDIPFRLIDRASEAPRGSRAKALQPRSLEVLNDLGVTDTLMPEGWTDLPYRKFSGTQLIGDTPRTIVPRDDTRFPAILLLPQYKVEQALRDKLTALGGSVEWGTELMELTQSENSITAVLATANGPLEMSCTYLAACDGGKSSTRKKLGINFVGETHAMEQLWVGDVVVDGLERDAWYTWLSPGVGLAFALFPFKHANTWQLQAVVLPDAEGNTPTPTLEGFNELFQQRTQMEGVQFTDSTWQSIYRVNIRRAEKYRVGNAFLAGDACHVHSIAGGMGMNTGIQDAYNLGWKLAAVINGEAAGDLLDTYAEERIPIADQLLATTSDRHKAMIQASTTGKGGFETLRTNDTTQLNLHYRDSSLTVRNEADQSPLQPGDRAPDVRLADGGWLSDQLRGVAWKKLLFGDAEAEPTKDQKIIKATDAAIMKAYGIEKGSVLIRPDGYIAAIKME